MTPVFHLPVTTTRASKLVNAEVYLLIGSMGKVSEDYGEVVERVNSIMPHLHMLKRRIYHI
jgi:hypothetical protein